MNIRKYIDKLYLNDRWTIGFIKQDVATIISDKNEIPQINWVKHKYKDRFFADPFILDVDDKGNIRVLVEEMIWTKAKGTIVELIISPNFEIIGRIPLLEENVHLSYPFIVRKNEGIYVYPESCRNNTLSEYKYDGKQLKFSRPIINEAICDATFLNYNSEKWCFCTRYGENQDDELYIYLYNRNEEKYKSIINNPVKKDLSSSRPGGNFVKLPTGELYRVAQNSTKSYGGGLTILKVLELNPNNYKEELVFYINPDSNGTCPNGIHTLNSYKGITVVDGIRERKFSPIRKLCFILKNLLRKL